MPYYKLEKVSLFEVESLIRMAQARQSRLREREQEPEYKPCRDGLEIVAESLGQEKINELVALMWLGRGASDEVWSDWPQLLRQAYGSEAEYLAEKIPLGEYLDAGLRKLGYQEDARLVIE